MILELDFCVLKFTEKFIISTVNENVHLTEEKSAVISQKIIDYYSNKPFIYITHRVNQYSVAPNVYQIVSKIKNLLGVIVVSDDKSSIKKSISEKVLLDANPFFEIFNDLEDAITWANMAFTRKRRMLE